ncbi:MAG: ABC transporter permease, partial [Bacteroidota bacterium]
MKNDIKTVIRLLRKDKSFFLINLTGLAIGIASFLVILHFVVHHASYDQNIKYGDRLVRLIGQYTQNGEDRGVGTVLPNQLAPTLQEELTYIEQSARFYDIGYNNFSIVYKQDDGFISYGESDVFLVDNAIFELFDWKFKHGGSARFDEPMKMVLTETTAKKYFGDKDPVGLEVSLAGNTGAKQLEIVGVINDLPKTSHIKFDLLVSYPSIDEYFQVEGDTWGLNTDISYFLLENEKDLSRLEKDAQEIFNNKTAEVEASTGYKADLIAERVRDIHLYTQATIEDFKSSMDYRLIYGLAIIAVIIVFIAWINYLNMSMVKTIERMREVGVRRVLGASGNHITRLFVIEAVMVVLFAFIIALTAVQISAPYLVEITDVTINVKDNPSLVLAVLLGLLLSASLVGTYPSLILRSTKSFEVLRGKSTGTAKGVNLRKLLIAVQFVVSFLLIAATLTVYNQLTYMKSADLGLDIEDIMVINSPPSAIQGLGESKRANYNAFKNDLSQYPSIAKFTNGGELP